MKKFLPIPLLMLLAGCSSGVVPAGPDTYMISRRVSGASTGAYSTAEAYREANEWCAKRGLVMVPVSSDSKDPGVGRFGSAQLVFRALKPGDPEIQRVSIEKPDYTKRVQVR